jgi:hypothetical protein
MVDVKSKRCEQDGCETLPAFDIKGGKGRFCVTHKTAQMVDVINKLCEQDGCNTRASFNVKGGKKRFCFKHKTAQMVDVINRRCIIENCETIGPSYGKPGNKPSHCAKHREKGMIRRPNSKCISCKEPAIYGTNYIPKHCEAHKQEDEQNLVEQECTSCHLTMVLDKDNKCEYCNPEAFQTSRLAKQNALMDYLDARKLKGSSTDTIIDNGLCGKERPDRIYELPDKILILECDEHQHRDRQCSCEQTRMVNIGQSFGGIPVYFIRWNPDDYSPESDRKAPELLKKRHKLCADLIRDIKKNKHVLPKGLVSVIYMYYDGWQSLAETEWQILIKIET